MVGAGRWKVEDGRWKSRLVRRGSGRNAGGDWWRLELARLARLKARLKVEVGKVERG